MAQQQGNIAQFTSPVDELHPNSDAARSLNAAAYEEGRMYKQAGQDYQQGIERFAGPQAKILDQHEAMADISQGAHALAAGTNNLQAEWNSTVQKSDPNDRTIQKSFLNNSLEPFLDNFQGSFTTQKGQEWALTRADDLRSHFTTTTESDMGVRAGEAVIKNTVGQVNQLSSGVYKDPSLLDQSMKQADAYYDAALEHNSGLLDAKQLAQINTVRQDAKNEMVKNAIKGYADSADPQGPSKARALLDSGNYDTFIPKDEQSVMHKYIDRQEDVRDVVQQQKTQAAQWQQGIEQSQQVKDVMVQVRSGQGYAATAAFANGKLGIQQKSDLVAEDGILSQPQSFLTSAAFGDNFSQVSKSLYDGKTMSADDITGAVRRREITPSGAIQLQELSEKMRTPEGLAEVTAQKQVLSQMETQIVRGGPGTNDPVGQKLYNDMHNSFYAAWDAGIKSGKTPAQLADSESKDYIGNLANVFKRSDAQALADVTQAKPPTPQEKPEAPPVLTDKSQFDTLPSGSLYMRNGTEYRKP